MPMSRKQNDADAKETARSQCQGNRMMPTSRKQRDANVEKQNDVPPQVLATKPHAMEGTVTRVPHTTAPRCGGSSSHGAERSAPRAACWMRTLPPRCRSMGLRPWF